MAVDWSGAATHEDRHLWVAEVDPDEDRVVALGPSTRQAAVDHLIDAASGDPLVAGLDFSFSLPAWWLEANRIDTVDELWADSVRLETWLADGRDPFWGRPGRARPGLPADREYRRTELAAGRRPRSSFQLGGAGSVGTGALRGMPHLARLRSAGIHLWPWDRWDAPVVAEVWPRLALGRTVKSSPTARAAWAAAHAHCLDARAAGAVLASDDALDAVAAARALGRTARAGRPALADRPDRWHPAVALEGWIDGVEVPTAPSVTGCARRE